MWQGDIELTWAKPVAEFVGGLHTRGVEVMWLTMWGDDANADVCRLLGLPRFPVAGTCADGWYDRGAWWKLQVAVGLFLADGTPFVWADDDLRRHPEAVEWASSLPDGAACSSPRTLPTGCALGISSGSRAS
jgi:hypothetical protein